MSGERDQPEPSAEHRELIARALDTVVMLSRRAACATRRMGNRMSFSRSLTVSCALCLLSLAACNDDPRPPMEEEMLMTAAGKPAEPIVVDNPGPGGPPAGRAAPPVAVAGAPAAGSGGAAGAAAGA